MKLGQQVIPSSKKAESGVMKSREQVISSPEAEHWRLRLMLTGRRILRPRRRALPWRVTHDRGTART
jgi:hypothetical protein